METQQVRASDGRGRPHHGARELLVLPSGGLIIDTPGLRRVSLATGGEGLDSVFSDIDELAQECRFGDCSHAGEPGCAVVEAIESGELRSAGSTAGSSSAARLSGSPVAPMPGSARSAPANGRPSTRKCAAPGATAPSVLNLGSRRKFVVDLESDVDSCAGSARGAFECARPRGRSPGEGRVLSRMTCRR